MNLELFLPLLFLGIVVLFCFLRFYLFESEHEQREGLKEKEEEDDSH